MIAQREQWAVLYHMSKIRGNIIEVDSHGQIRESIGDRLWLWCDNRNIVPETKMVTCIELSRKRSMINAYRNQSNNNIYVYMGNFAEIEKNLKEPFDIITLIGVFEYAQGYIEGQEPYIEFLNKIRSHLSEKGRIIAIENQLGLKYWAGCREDHTGGYFDGLEDTLCKEASGHFLKKNWKKFLKMSIEGRIFYPYPDYKLPTAIYSDYRLPKVGELSHNNQNFDRTG